MKYVITGSLGNISKPLSLQLIAAKHDVTIISSNPSKQHEIEALGASAAIGSVEDVDFLTSTFKGADAVYTMVPPNYGASNWKEYIASIGKNYARAIQQSGVSRVVNLSSIGAHLPEGCGPVSGLFYVEKALNELNNVHVKHIRAGYFYQNLLNNIGLIKHQGIIGGNYGDNSMMTFVSTDDIAQHIFQCLTDLSFEGKSSEYVISDERSTTDVARTLGNVINIPDLTWINFKDEDALGGMIHAGLPEEIAKNFVEMGSAMRSGKMTEDYKANNPIHHKTKLEDFAKTFAKIYSAQ